MSSKYDPNKVDFHIKKKIPNAECLMCHTPLDRDVIEEMKTVMTNANFGDENIQLICKNCGYVMPFDPRKISFT